MAFPLKHKGTIELDLEIDDGAEMGTIEKMLLRRIAKELREAKARKVQIQGNSVRFKGGLFRLVSNLNVLSPITAGSIAIHRSDRTLVVAYVISFEEMLVAASGMVALLGAFLAWNDQVPISSILSVSLIAWLILFGGNSIYAVVRFRDFIQRIVESV